MPVKKLQEAGEVAVRGPQPPPPPPAPPRYEAGQSPAPSTPPAPPMSASSQRRSNRPASNGPASSQPGSDRPDSTQPRNRGTGRVAPGPQGPGARPGGPNRGLRSLVSREAWAGVKRPADHRVLAGVTTPLADTIGVSVLGARWALVALTFVGGVGIAIYIVAWLFLPSEGSDRTIASAAFADRRSVQLVAATATGLVVLLICVSLLGTPSVVGAVSPGLVSLAGLVAIWRHAGAEDRVAAQRLAALLSGASPAGVPTTGVPTRRRLLYAVVRFVAGAGLIVVCTSKLLRPKDLNSTDLTVALAALGVIAGFALILAPWWLRLGRELSGERRERARAEQRAEIAEHLHDSVLQTLALIQRSADDPQQVQRLARAQERQLRSWLFDGAPRGPMGLEHPCTVSEALASLQQDLENMHRVKVEVVTVGDANLDERSMALMSAAREAAVNSAKWSGADEVSIYAEVEPDEISVFVRDRGRGFDPKAVAKDRKGISESIKARLARNGGTATIRSAPGEGTDVALKLPRKAQN